MKGSSGCGTHWLRMVRRSRATDSAPAGGLPSLAFYCDVESHLRSRHWGACAPHPPFREPRSFALWVWTRNPGRIHYLSWPHSGKTSLLYISSYIWSFYGFRFSIFISDINTSAPWLYYCTTTFKPTFIHI